MSAAIEETAINAKIRDYLNREKETSPLLVIDLEEVRNRYRALKEAFPAVEVFYAMKANPHREVVKALIEQGSSIDAASWGEVEAALDLHCPPEKISYGNVAKKSSDIRKAYDRGVRLFVFDCEEELRKLAEHAPAARVFYRIGVANKTALLPLDRKFGESAATGKHLLALAKDLRLEPVGVSFHVGSQQLDAQAWVPVLDEVFDIIAHCRKNGMELNLINLGGGLPGPSREQRTVDIEGFLKVLQTKLASLCDMRKFRFLMEPGRYLCASGGILQTTVTLATPSEESAEVNWIFLDCGRYHGLWETTDGQLRVVLHSPDKNGPLKRSVITGPTCDNFDTLYEKEVYLLPENLVEGDRIWFLDAGAYSYSMGTDFNGFPSAKTVCLD